MTRSRKALLAAIAVLGIGVAGTAPAQTYNTMPINTMPINTMTVAVPGGGVAQIRYVGDVPPQIVFAPAPGAFPGGFGTWMPVSSAFGYDSPFAMFDRIAAEMDRRMAAMFRYAEAAADRADTGGVAETAFGAMQPGAIPAAGQSYSYVSTISGSGVCTQSVRIVSRGDGTPPLVERHSSGNCGTAEASPGRSRVLPAAPAPVAPAKQHDLILTHNGGATPYAGMVRQVASAR